MGLCRWCDGRPATACVCLQDRNSVCSSSLRPAGSFVNVFRLAAVLVSSILALLPSNLVAQNGSLAGTIVVAVGGKPLAAAEIAVPTLKLSTRSDSVGRYLLSSIPAGTHEVTVRAIGYQLLSAKLEFRTSQEVRATFQMNSNAPTLETIKVQGTLDPRWARRLVEFDARRNGGVGVFLTHEKLEKNASMSVPAILATFLPGVRITRMGGSDVAISSRGGRNCPLQILMNRLNMYNGESLYFDVNSIEADEILGVEYYNAFSTPSEFNLRPRGPYGGSRCGTLVLWMK